MAPSKEFVLSLAELSRLTTLSLSIQPATWTEHFFRLSKLTNLVTLRMNTIWPKEARGVKWRPYSAWIRPTGWTWPLEAAASARDAIVKLHNLEELSFDVCDAFPFQLVAADWSTVTPKLKSMAFKFTATADEHFNFLPYLAKSLITSLSIKVYVLNKQGGFDAPWIRQALQTFPCLTQLDLQTLLLYGTSFPTISLFCPFPYPSIHLAM